jgi:hypothetical protein
VKSCPNFAGQNLKLNEGEQIVDIKQSVRCKLKMPMRSTRIVQAKTEAEDE